MPLMLLVLLTGIALATDPVGTPAPSGSWTLAATIAAAALAASWLGVIFVILRFAADVGRFTTTVEHLKTSVEGLTGKLDALSKVETTVAVHAQRLGAVEGDVVTLQSGHSQLASAMSRLQSVSMEPAVAAGRRKTEGG